MTTKWIISYDYAVYFILINGLPQLPVILMHPIPIPILFRNN